MCFIQVGKTKENVKAIFVGFGGWWGICDGGGNKFTVDLAPELTKIRLYGHVSNK